MKHPPLKDQFPLRSEPRPGESREGYMWRLCAENGHAMPLEVRRALGRLAEYGHDKRTHSVQELIGEEHRDASEAHEGNGKTGSSLTRLRRLYAHEPLYRDLPRIVNTKISLSH